MILYGAEAPPRHGGDLSVARRLFPDAREPFIDLSTGINPNPYKLPRLPAGLFSRLPDGEATEALAAAAARAYGAPSAACIVAAPGSQILLPLAAALARPGLAAILTPSYGEFAPAAQMAGHAVRPIEGLGECGEAALAIIGNPNNPDGRVFAGDALIALADRLGARGGLLVVDEAFMDVGAPGASLAGAVLRGNIVVLRSFGKFFGLAGLRLGFALATPALATRLAAALGPWAVSGPAQVIGAQALADTDWIERTRRRLANAAKRLDSAVPASISSAARACSGWRGRRRRTRCTGTSGVAASSCGRFPIARFGCASGYPRMAPPGIASRLPWPPFDQLSGPGDPSCTETGQRGWHWPCSLPTMA